MQQNILSVLETARYQMVKVTLNYGLIKVAKRHVENSIWQRKSTINQSFSEGKKKTQKNPPKNKTTSCRCKKDHNANSSHVEIEKTVKELPENFK